MQCITERIEKFLTEAGIPEIPSLTTPPNSAMGDIALPCFDLAKKEGRNPAEVAKGIVEKLGNTEIGEYPIIERIEAQGPYVNFFLNTAEVAHLVLSEIFQHGEKYGTNTEGRGKKVMVEYPSQNSHKEFHIGHLRNVCIGNTLIALYRACGYTMVPVNYINDFGSHVVKVLWGIQKFHPNEEPLENKQKWLGDVYVEANTYIEEHSEVKAEVEALQVKFEARDPEIWPLFLKTREWSIQGFEAIHRELAVHHEAIFYESDVKDRGQELVDELFKKGIASEGERGAIILDLSSYGLDIALLRKSTGAGVYMTSDLALAEKKFAHHDIDESITITGTEQNFYFRQLFKVIELNGFTSQLTHVGYALVNLPEGKMSSRKGNVILYEDLRSMVYAELLRETQARHPDWDTARIDTVVTILTLAVLKFSMQKHEAGKSIIFDMKEAVSFEGFSAPYILYVVARIKSILRKAGATDGTKNSRVYQFLTQPEEKKLLLLLSGFADMVKKAKEMYNPSGVARYCFDLAQAFNEFYAKQSILQAESDTVRDARLLLSQATKHVLEQALSLLTIQTVEEM